MFRSQPDGGNLVPKLVPKLDSEMTEAADALHRNQITRRRAAVSQSIKRGDSRAQQRACFGIAKCVWYGRQCFDGSNHVFLISAVVVDACNFGVAAVKEASTSALETGVVPAAVPTHADTLSFLPSGDLGTKFIDYACNFVPRNPRILNSRPEAFFHK